jgi:hypothetical protein
MKLIIPLMLLAVILIAASTTFGQVPKTLSYQGVLTGVNGNPAPNGSYQLTFRIYAEPSGGTPLWAETQSANVQNGVFSVILGKVSALNLAFDKTYWLGITVEQGSELAPRTELTAAAYSLNAAAIADSIVTGDKIADGHVVRSLNGLSDAVYLSATGGATITTSGDTLTINPGSSGGGSGILGVQNTNNTLTIANPNGPTATINVKDGGIGSAQLANDAVSSEKIADGGVSTADISDNAVNSQKIADGSVTSPDLADSTITGGKIAPGQVVRSLNGLTDEVKLSAGANIILAPQGDSLVIAAAGGGTSPWQVTGNHISYDLGNVGIGTARPTQKLDIANGDVRVQGALYLRPDSAALPLVALRAGDTGEGEIITRGRNGSVNVQIDNMILDANYGSVAVYDDKGTARASMQAVIPGIGVIAADQIWGDLAVFNGRPGVDPIEARITGSTKFMVHDNGGVSIGSDDLPAADGLNVTGKVTGVAAEFGGTVTIDVPSGTPLDVRGDGDSKFKVDGNGRIGIGTDAPAATVHSSGSGSTANFLSDGGVADFAVPSGQNMQIGHWDGGAAVFTERMRIDGNGNVGIGETDPTAKLSVDGKVYIDNLDEGTLTAGEALLVDGTVDITGWNDGTTLSVSNSRADIGPLVNLSSPGTLAAGQDILQIRTGSNPTLGDPIVQFIECQYLDSDAKFRVNSDGNVYADGSFNGGGADFAEMIAVSSGGLALEAGDVLIIDPNNTRSVVKCTAARSTLVAGIYSSKPGFVGSERDWDRRAGMSASNASPATGDPANVETATYTMTDMAAEFSEIPMAVVGIVPCKVSAENGAVRPGDLLVTSATPGHAMRDDNPKTGTVLGKALGSLNAGTGLIKVLVTLQ